VALIAADANCSGDQRAATGRRQATTGSTEGHALPFSRGVFADLIPPAQSRMLLTCSKGRLFFYSVAAYLLMIVQFVILLWHDFFYVKIPECDGK
jgi:hypothetical protein